MFVRLQLLLTAVHGVCLNEYDTYLVMSKYNDTKTAARHRLQFKQ